MSTIERALAKAAAALLPPLLPTPPRSMMLAPCLIVSPAPIATSPSKKPGRADTVERWDLHKTNKPFRPASSGGSNSGSSGRASSCERWDSKKRSTSPSSSRGSNGSPGRADAVERWDSNKRPPSRASSADRLDTHKKSRSAQADTGRLTDEQAEQEIDMAQKDETTTMIATVEARVPTFSGARFFASPEPSRLPMPSFFLMAR